MQSCSRMDDSDKLSIEVFGLQCLRTAQALNEPIYLSSGHYRELETSKSPQGSSASDPSCGEVAPLMPLPLPVWTPIARILRCLFQKSELQFCFYFSEETS